MNRRDLLKTFGLGAMALIAHESGLLLLEPRRVYSFPKEIKLYKSMPEELESFDKSLFWRYLVNKSYVIPPPGVPKREQLVKAFSAFGSGLALDV